MKIETNIHHKDMRMFDLVNVLDVGEPVYLNNETILHLKPKLSWNLLNLLPNCNGFIELDNRTS